jgi:mono/diheme cytochrome c family protein
MRLKYCAAGLAVLIAVGLWQVRAAPDAADLTKHGEYLVSRVAQCGDCHTPRDAKGEPDRSRMLRGATLGFVPRKKTEHWADMSPDITGSGVAGKWSEEQMIKFFTTGVNPDGKKPTPPMPVYRLQERDARAIILYLKSLPGKKPDR